MSFPMGIDDKAEESQLTSHDLNKAAPFDLPKFNLAVMNAIAECKAKDPTVFRDDDWLTMREHPILLQILLDKVSQERRMNQGDLTQYLDQRGSLRMELTEAYAIREFTKLLDNPDMPLQRAKLSMNPSGSNSSPQSAFEQPYIGNTAELFIQTLNRIRISYAGRPAAERAYNWSLAVVQSSGMGKSRMVEESSNSVFTIPINIREEPTMGEKVYPPPDKNLRRFFKDCQGKNDDEQQLAYAVLLRFLFTETLKLVDTLFPTLNGIELARAWAKYLKEGQTEDEVGTNRRKFYESVVKLSNDFQRENIPKLTRVVSSLFRSCANLTARVHGTHNNACIMYFDEAHSLMDSVQMPSEEHKHSAYNNLGTVLSELTKSRIFFIFLSNNPCLKGFAPPACNYPSFRVTTGSQLIPPFTELPFDLYELEVLRDLSLTLENMCKTKVMVGFGRALWYAELKIRPNDNIFTFAIDRLAPKNADDSLLAALGVRVGITFDKTNPNSHSVQSRLVESHLRVVYAIPHHQNYMHTGSPSEPILAEAAARYLYGAGGIAAIGPNRLSLVLGQGLLVREEHGELAGRLLVTCAHDIALQNSIIPTSPEPQYHRPLKVVDFLCALFHKDHHRSILNAVPIIYRTIAGQPDADPLSKAFSESYVFFSHFALAEDSEMMSAPALATALVRGMAIQAKDGQASIDAVIPIHMGSLTTPISAKTTSAINLQFKNRNKALDRYVNRSISIPDAEMPVISIIFEFGVTETMSDPISITSKLPRCDQEGKPHRDDLHYQIVVHGCNSALFGAIPTEAEEHYKAILGTGTILPDFPRNKNKENREALLEMKPAFSGGRQKELYSELWDCETE